MCLPLIQFLDKSESTLFVSHSEILDKSETTLFASHSEFLDKTESTLFASHSQFFRQIQVYTVCLSNLILYCLPLIQQFLNKS